MFEKKSFAFTTYCRGYENVLSNLVEVAPAYDPESGFSKSSFRKYRAVWDTGATHSAITSQVVRDFALRATGMAVVYDATTTQNVHTFSVNILLPNHVEFPDWEVTEAGGLVGNEDILIGMDIIGTGDFAVSNKERTVFTFRYPSQEEISFSRQG